MAVPLPEQLFSLELLVEWVRLEARVLPSPVAAAGEEEEASLAPAPPPPLPPGSVCPAVAFRLLDFPTLLVYPPGGPATPAPEAQPGVVIFGRGKSCLFRLHPATLRRLLRRTPLYTLLLQLHPGRPTPAPQLLGSCGISLATAVQEVLGPAASVCSQSHRGSYALLNLLGEQIGDIGLRYRLTALGNCLLGHLERPVPSTGGGLEQREGKKVDGGCPQPLPEKQEPRHVASEPGPDSDPVGQMSLRDDRHLVDLKVTKAQKNSKEVVFHHGARSVNIGSVEKDKTNSVVICSSASCRKCNRFLNQEVTELDIETNTFCPPPLYYTHFTEEKRPPATGKITLVPQVNMPEELDGVFPEENLVNPTAQTSPVRYMNTTPKEGPSVLTNPPAHIQDTGGSDQTACYPQTEQNRIHTIRQLPLLNALLVELSLLYNQPMAGPTDIHPHLAWLYRTEDKKAPDSSAKSTCESESKKEKLAMEEKSVSLRYRKNQVENLKKGLFFEKNSAVPPKQVPRGRLLYGITNTLKLRLKQTNPDMLIVHEKREQYRKMQAQMLGAKLRIPSSKVKVLSYAEQLQKLPQLAEHQCLDSDATFAEKNDTSRQISGVFDDPSTAKETKLKCAADKKTVGYTENRANSGSLEEISATKSIISEKFTQTNILDGKAEVKVQTPSVFQQEAVTDKIVIDKEITGRQVKTTDDDMFITDTSENKLSSCSESISKLKYSDDFTSPCYSEDFSTTEDISRSLQACDSSPENPKHCQYTSQSSEARSPLRKNSSDKSSILSPPFSAGSPVHSNKRCHISKSQHKSFEEAPSMSTSDLSSTRWTEENEKKIDQNSVPNSKVIKRGQDISIKTKTDCTSYQSPRTSQVSSYLPSNLSELELNALDSNTSEKFEEDSDEVGSLSISKQCRDICELVINKLPGYTV